MACCTAHEELDDPLCPRRVVRCGEDAVEGKKIGEGEAPEGAGERPEEISA